MEFLSQCHIGWHKIFLLFCHTQGHWQGKGPKSVLTVKGNSNQTLIVQFWVDIDQCS